MEHLLLKSISLSGNRLYSVSDAVQAAAAAGHKLRRTVNSGGIIETTDYAGNAVYDGFSLAMLQIPGGYVTLSGTTPTYHYYLHYYPSLSPYTYCANSPANIVDPNGMEWIGLQRIIPIVLFGETI